MNEFMCSEECPCFDSFSNSNLWTATGSRMNEPSVAYSTYSEAKLNKYGRTNEGKAGYKPLKFVNGTTVGVMVTFEQCLMWWYEEKKSNPSIDLVKTFTPNFSPDVDNIDHPQFDMKG